MSHIGNRAVTSSVTDTPKPAYQPILSSLIRTFLGKHAFHEVSRVPVFVICTTQPARGPEVSQFMTLLVALQKSDGSPSVHKWQRRAKAGERENTAI